MDDALWRATRRSLRLPSWAVLILVLMDDALWQKLKTSKKVPSHAVLILVLMDDALWLPRIYINFIIDKVLILVLMDDALWHGMVYRLCKVWKRLNPCFNGWCTLTWDFGLPRIYINCLNPCFNGWCTLTVRVEETETIKVEIVLILVLMDDALWQPLCFGCKAFWRGLNPCFNGWCTLT